MKFLTLTDLSRLILHKSGYRFRSVNCLALRDKEQVALELIGVKAFLILNVVAAAIDLA